MSAVNPLTMHLPLTRTAMREPIASLNLMDGDEPDGVRSSA